MEAKAIAILVALLGLVAGVWWYGEHRYSQGHTAGAAQVQTAWDTDKAQIQATAAAAVAAATKEKEDALTNNAGVINDLNAQLESARGLNAQLSNGLRDYKARVAAGSGALPKTNGGPATAPAPSAPGVGQTDDINQLTADTLDECYTNFVRYSALIKELSLQL